jgi:hypothetical protein
MSKEIQALEAEVDRLEAELRDAKQRLRDAGIAASGVSIGDIVLRKNVRYRVTSIDPASWRQKVWIQGNPERRDGSFGTAERNLFDDWKKETER